MLDRMNNKMTKVLSEEAFNHWSGIGDFFRGIMEYTDLVTGIWDVPFTIIKSRAILDLC